MNIPENVTPDVIYQILIIEQINSLNKSIEVNKGFFGDEDTQSEANEKIRELIKKIK